MKKLFWAFAAIVSPAAAFAQSAIDAYNLSQQDLRGTARYMSMAGAFGALGGDLSTLNNNPAGIGVYRSSEIGLTVDLSMSSSKGFDNPMSASKTSFNCNNFGYVGAVDLDSDIMPYFQWGVTYSRVASFDRKYRGRIGALETSLTNYIANFTDGMSTSDLANNPYWYSDADWLSILGYNSYLINPVGTASNYNGLWNEGVTSGDAEYYVSERGYVDEYSINFGGNFVDRLYWGIGFGITDIGFIQRAWYDEKMANAQIPKTKDGSETVRGDAYYVLDNYRHIEGTGFNFKVGLIFKPINELRLGLAIHTPTYYNLSCSGDGFVDYSFGTGLNGVEQTPVYDYDWKLRTPWKFIGSVAGVIGGRFILSADYEMDAYKDMRVQDDYGDDIYAVNNEIKAYFKPVNTIRLGAEFRVTPQFSVRAGFAHSSSAVREEANNGDIDINTSDWPMYNTNPAYTFDQSTRYVTLGVGYKINRVYLDLTYVNKYRESTYHPFTSYDDAYGPMYAPYSDFKTTNNQIVLSAGYKF